MKFPEIYAKFVFDSIVGDLYQAHLLLLEVDRLCLGMSASASITLNDLTELSSRTNLELELWPVDETVEHCEAPAEL